MAAALKMAGGTSPEGKLAELKAQRSVLTERIAGLTAAHQQLDAATDGERAAKAAIAELEAAEEVAEMSAWAAQGAVGAAPKPDLVNRPELAQRLSGAQATAAAARSWGQCRRRTGRVASRVGRSRWRHRSRRSGSA